MTQEQNMLLVTGEKKEEDKAEYLHRGIAGRAFERRFQLADHVKVTGAGLENGLLTIDLKREIPEEMKPRRIEIGSVTATPKVAQRKIEAERQAA
jgi:molecular chaperone IbpA